MKGLHFVRRKAEEIDEHDSPTEPVPRSASVLSGQGNQDKLPELYTTVPVPTSSGATFQPPSTQHDRPAYPLWQVWRWPQLIPAFVLRLVPLGIGMCFVGLQLLLLLRFTLKIWHSATTLVWVNGVYASSELALLPFHILLPPLHQELFMYVEPYTLLAVIVYGICSRILVHLLKIIVKAYLTVDRRTETDMRASKTAGSTN
ncbi:hypothetical protein KDW_08720 [Dictyobacter vulcani]|uniref:YggT family protein n=1 Tax=Dictyobacter vulcani TaxID=2607529 RepID=A0A5J4KK21_9CHLR|nr:hypothetical protein [Dictyobacter vulcani]GER86710.1 hypothetical protein KDW_08720 [Dictyobacter vulcani]